MNTKINPGDLRCLTCAYSVVIAPDVAECRRHSPVPSNNSMSSRGTFPEVISSLDWCGDYSRKLNKDIRETA